MASPDSKGQTVYQCWWDSLEIAIWKDEFSKIKVETPWPQRQTLMELLKKDTAAKFIDNVNTTEKETLYDVVTSALKKATVNLAKLEVEGKLEWTNSVKFFRRVSSRDFLFLVELNVVRQSQRRMII